LFSYVAYNNKTISESGIGNGEGRKSWLAMSQHNK